jgi:hypothetical protein
VDEDEIGNGMAAQAWDRDHGAYDGGIAWGPVAFALGIFLVLVVIPVTLDRLTPYARACRAQGGVPAISQRVCYVHTTKEIMKR